MKILADVPGSEIGRKYKGRFVLIECPSCRESRWTRKDELHKRKDSDGMCRKCFCSMIGKVHLGLSSWNKNRKWSAEHRENLSRIHLARTGGLTEKNKVIRANTDMKEWRLSVFKRDGWKCQKCFRVGGTLNAHHKKPFSQYPELRTDINNGVTLCKTCHRKEHYASKRNN